MNAVLERSTVTDASAAAPEPGWDHSQVPAWFAASQREAWQKYHSLPAPTRRDEAWRFASLNWLQLDGFRPQRGGPPGGADLLEETSVRLVFANDRLVSRSGEESAVEVLTLRDALARHGDRLADVLVTPDTGLGGAKFAAMHHALLQDAVVVVVPDGVELAKPVEIVHWLSGDATAAYPRTIVLAGEGSRVAILEHHLSADGGAQLSCGATQVIASRGAAVQYALISGLGEGSRTMHFSTIRCAADAAVIHALVTLGDAQVRTECLSHVSGEGARSDMLGISVPRGDQEVDHRTLQHHASPRTFSDLLYKNVLAGSSRTVFAGLIRVDEGAHFTDAYQKCRNLLLTEECEANSMPGLEINADQVKCSHGATSGRLEEEQVFYFQSRGIPGDEAARLIATGFAAEVAGRIPRAGIRELILRRLNERFAQLEISRSVR